MQNTSGRHPVGWLLILKMNPVEDKLCTGILAKTEHAVAQDDLAQTLGVVVAMGPGCFHDEIAKGWGPRCQVGDEVSIQRYTGEHFKGPDDVKYRIVTDKDILTVIEPKPGV